MFIVTLLFTISCIVGIFAILGTSKKKKNTKVMILPNGSKIYPVIIKHVNTWI